MSTVGCGQGRCRIEFSPSGRQLAAGVADAVLVWDVDAGSASSPRRLPSRDTFDLAFADDRRLAAGGADRAVQLWALDTGEPIGEPLRHDGSITSVAFGEHSTILITTGNDQATRVWNVEALKPHSATRFSRSIPFSARLSSAWLFAAATVGGGVDIWSHDRGRANSVVPHGAAALIDFDSQRAVPGDRR